MAGRFAPFAAGFVASRWNVRPMHVRVGVARSRARINARGINLTMFDTRFILITGRTPGASAQAVAAGASAALAFTGACIAHEVAGHAGACIGGGSTVAQVTSWLFICRPGILLADLGGPGANLLVGAASLLLLRGRRRGTVTHVLLALSAAFNLFWAAGCLIEGAVAARGDFAYAARLAGALQLPLRIAFGAMGVGLALMTCRLIGRQGLPRATLRCAYWVAGAAACASALLYTGPVGPALREAALESFGAMAWLWVVRPRPAGADTGAEPAVGASSWRLPVSASVAFGLLLALGHGYTAPM
jgi:hypothetical protein